MVDRVKPLKFEDASSGGTETDDFPTSTNPAEDHLDSAGVVIQRYVGPGENDHTNDEVVRVYRDDSDPDRMMFLDGENTTPVPLATLVAGSGGLTADQHKVLRQLIHFIDNGPAEGFTSGAYREMTGTVFPTQVMWWESSSKLKKIVEKNIMWTGINPTTIEWKIYDTDGSTVLATVSDAISYSGVFETSRTRTITVS